MRIQRLSIGVVVSIFICIMHTKDSTMNAVSHRYQLSLEPRGLFEIPDVSGVQISCTAGSLWITLDHDTRDIVLEAGDSFVSTEHRRAIVYAFQASTLALRAPGAKPRQERAASLHFAAEPQAA
jgi:hypothetical protein